MVPGHIRPVSTAAGMCCRTTSDQGSGCPGALLSAGLLIWLLHGLCGHENDKIQVSLDCNFPFVQQSVGFDTVRFLDVSGGSERFRRTVLRGDPNPVRVCRNNWQLGQGFKDCRVIGFLCVFAGRLLLHVQSSNIVVACRCWILGRCLSQEYVDLCAHHGLLSCIMMFTATLRTKG